MKVVRPAAQGLDSLAGANSTCCGPPESANSTNRTSEVRSRRCTRPRSGSPGTLDRYFANFGIRIDPDEVQIGGRGSDPVRGLVHQVQSGPDDAGDPSLEFYATIA